LAERIDINQAAGRKPVTEKKIRGAWLQRLSHYAKQQLAHLPILSFSMNSSTPMMQTTNRDEAAGRLNLAVGIATSGRRDILSETIKLLAAQKRLPDRLIVCPVKPDDVDSARIAAFPASAEIVSGPVGLPAQRNRILAACHDADVIVFFDDDFFVGATYLAAVEKIFLANPKLVALTGELLADGINGPGIGPREGLAILNDGDRAADKASFLPISGTYGCNMAFRMAPITAHALSFDENLPLYGWQEDIDFSRRIGRHGTIGKSTALRGVHLGSKGGRTSGVRLGYSQIANLIYLLRKGSIPAAYALRMIGRNMLANHVKVMKPEPWIDRRGRCRGNWIAVADWLRGQDDPRRILSL
jgi:GT2 family glycosyltransferase